jgi:hypothetical protein
MTKKLLIFVSVLIFMAVFTGCTKQVENKPTADGKYIAYYFHPTARCESCLNLESFLKEMIEKKYAKQGFEFKEVNIEDRENQHYRKDYSLKFSSVIISKVESGKETNWKNLDSVWSYTDNKEKFFIYSEREIDNFINNIK